jgi:ribokinase
VPPDIGVVGGINMDLVVKVPHIPRSGETVQGGAVAKFPGGKGANQAVAACRLGGSVAMVGQVGQDVFGEELLRSFESVGVDTVGVRRVATGSTGMALISVARDGQNAIVVAPGVNMAWSEEAVHALGSIVPACRALVLNLEIPPEVVARAVHLGKHNGVPVILNPAPYRRGDEPSFGEIALLVPNQVEAAEFAGVDPERVRDWGKIGRHLRSLGPQTVIITLGNQGALLVTQTGETHVPGFPVPVVDTTAAGDAFVGGLAVATVRGLTVGEAVSYANACGALAVTKAGAQPSLPTAAEVEKLLAGKKR